MKKLICAISAAILCGAARAEEPVGEETSDIVSAEVSISFDSKYLSYGLVDNNEPILTPDASITIIDWLTIGAYAIFDVTKYGHRAGYTARQFEYNELHPYVEIGHSFSSEDFEWLPTTVEFSFGYDYEYHPNSKRKGSPVEDEDTGDFLGWDKSMDEDTQFVTFELSLPDLWLEPAFLYERDIMRDNGTYLNLELGHTFALIDGEDEDSDPVLSLRPSIAQGWGSRQRVAAYLESPNRNGLMDTAVKCALTWAICDNLELSGYVQYTDFLFDSGVRDAAREYEATGDWHDSYNFTGGFALTASF